MDIELLFEKIAERELTKEGLKPIKQAILDKLRSAAISHTTDPSYVPLGSRYHPNPNLYLEVSCEPSGVSEDFNMNPGAYLR